LVSPGPAWADGSGGAPGVKETFFVPWEGARGARTLDTPIGAARWDDGEPPPSVWPEGRREGGNASPGPFLTVVKGMGGGGVPSRYTHWPAGRDV
jgi:hypothetical protein